MSKIYLGVIAGEAAVALFLCRTIKKDLCLGEGRHIM